jgi:hypothetical protein
VVCVCPSPHVFNALCFERNAVFAATWLMEHREKSWRWAVEHLRKEE